MNEDTYFIISRQLLDSIVMYLKARPWGEVAPIMDQIKGLQMLAPRKEEVDNDAGKRDTDTDRDETKKDN